MLEQLPPLVGQMDAAALADQQLRAQLVLELAHLPAERRLRHVEVLRRARDAAELGDLGEIVQSPEIQGRPLMARHGEACRNCI